VTGWNNPKQNNTSPSPPRGRTVTERSRSGGEEALLYFSLSPARERAGVRGHKTTKNPY